MTTRYFKYFMMLLLASMTTACGEDLMDDINTESHRPSPDIINAKFQVTDAITSTVFSTLSGDYSFYLSSYTEQLFGTGGNQLRNAELRERGETAANTTFNNVWNSTYSNINSIKQILAKCEDGGLNAGEIDIRGIGQILWILNFQALTDLHGDIPYSEATNVLQPKIDKQEEIYKDFFRRIDSAITDLKGAVAAKMNNCGSQDILFDGKPDKWLGLAYAVKTRLLLNKGYRDPGAYSELLTVAQQAIDAGFTGADFKKFNGVDCDNPWSAYHWSRYYTAANGTLYDIMATRNDPRLALYAQDSFKSGITHAPAGDKDFANLFKEIGYPAWLDNGGQTGHVLSLHEFYFTIAEAKARLGQDFSMEFSAAVNASFDDWSAACGEQLTGAAEYIAALTPSLNEVMIQKYIAATRDEHIQTYNDIRRFKAEGREFIQLRNPNNSAAGLNMWPLRLPYGNSDVVSNPNVAAAFGSGNEAGNYLFTENVWLFGGNR